MPYWEDTPEVVRSTWCWKKTARAAVRVMAPGRVAPGGTAEMLVAVQWQVQAEDSRLILRFAQDDPPAGEIRYEGSPPAVEPPSEDPEHEWIFPGGENAYQVLGIRGAGPSGGAIPDVILQVELDGEAQEAGRLAVGTVSRTVAIKAEDGRSEPPIGLESDEPLTLTAVATPAAEGTTTWMSLYPSALRLRPAEDGARVEVREGTGRQDLILGVLFVPEGGGPGAMAIHRLRRAAEMELEAAFAEHLLRDEHIDDVEYRRRLEAKTPDEVRSFLDRTDANRPEDRRVRDYLERLLEFVENQEALRQTREGERRSITFIMGEDPPDSSNLFYTGATAYFALHPTDDLLEMHRTLIAVRDYLAVAERAGERPWGEINIVVHANEEGGMTIPVLPVPDGEDPEMWQANLLILEDAIDNGDFEPLPDSLVDAGTVINIRGCSLGRSPEMLNLLSRAFGGEGLRRPTVRASRHVQAFDFSPEEWRVDSSDSPTAAENYFVEFWFLGFPAGNRPPNSQLAPQFRARFPDVGVDWDDALSRPGNPSGDLPAWQDRTRRVDFDPSWDYFPIPANQAALEQLVGQIEEYEGATNVVEVSRTRRADGSLDLVFNYVDADGIPHSGATIPVGPSLPTNDAERLARFRREERFGQDLARIGRTWDDYTWTFTSTDEALAGGLRRLSMVGTGRRTIVRVERELRGPDSANPGQTRRLHPPVTNLTHFGEEVPVRPAEPTGQNVLPRSLEEIAPGD